ncbi:hypothetical protein [Kaistia granuli]|uniref:hypothetical protein n=1 Tax=Kaistia granuli TaxID=363259 RepID=UPI00036256CB|nr:hypothetical protein [Kaistia granuli]
MPDITVQVHNVARIKADAHQNRLFLSMRNEAGEAAEFFSIGLDSEGLALRLAARINAEQMVEAAPVYPAADRKVA